MASWVSITVKIKTRCFLPAKPNHLRNNLTTILLLLVLLGPVLGQAASPLDQFKSRVAYAMVIPSLPSPVLRRQLREDLLEFVKKAENFPRLIGRNYTFPDAFESAFLQEFTFDTKEDDLKGQGYTYALRYKWSSEAAFLRHQIFPGIKNYFPLKCEISLIDSSAAPHLDFIFRNDSAPFTLSYDAPPPPWPAEEFLAYAQSGRYKDHEIPAFARLGQILNRVEVFLVPKERHLIQRSEIWLALANPWGEAGLIQLKLDLAKAEIQPGTFAQSLRLSAELSNQVIQNISSFAAAKADEAERQTLRQKRLARTSRLVQEALGKDFEILEELLSARIRKWQN